MASEGHRCVPPAENLRERISNRDRLSQFAL
jgi:hypothetical protein